MNKYIKPNSVRRVYKIGAMKNGTDKNKPILHRTKLEIPNVQCGKTELGDFSVFPSHIGVGFRSVGHQS